MYIVIFMLVGFYNLEGHSQNLAIEDVSIFSAELSSLSSVEYKSIDYNFMLAYKHLTSANKFARASVKALGYNITMGTILFLSPESFTNWSKDDKLSMESILNQFEESYSNLPVKDNDDWPVNYVGASISR